ncbi:BCLAF1 and THRAP3 family member 3 [Phyllostomus discolor]|uniref:BCLAF1 and THRAP3 family member 3 n=1 Tax=Phyllostomus discolor TaxID=89673 RepID=A0A7E6D037_9CHIR|nr:BCLAF1 and THRAP3 family member 3 isoform X1 [Phyllostomus discolor]KAF6090078.1 BCLAF1 and THRAP3 family member 3 [Phyllostomus discolor]
MARSRSRSSPKRKQRPSSPAPRKSEHYKQRSSRGYHSFDHRKDLNRSTTWRMHKNGQRRSRNSSRENTYYRYYKRRSSSPNTRSSSDKFYSYKPYQAYSPGREDGNRYMPRYSESAYYPQYQWDYYPQHARGRSVPYDHRGRRSGKRGKSPRRSTEDSSRFERKQREDELRSQKTRDEKYSHSLRRRSEDGEKRSSFQKRHTEDRDYRRRGHTSTRHTGVERHDNRELSRNRQCKPRHSPSPHQEKRAQRSPKYQAHRHAPKRPPETSSSTRASSDSRHKRRKTSDGDQELSDGKSQKYSKEEDRKSTPQNDNGKSSCSHAGRQREAEDGKDKSPLKSSKKHYTASAHSDKSVDFRTSDDKPKMERKKERDDRKESNSSSNHLDESKASDMKPSSTSLRKKSLIIKVNEKKTVNASRVASIKTESEMSADLSAVSKKSEDSEPVLENLGSTENTENKSKEEFAQEIITVIHQVKVNYFPSPPITLHERFSKLKDQQAIDGHENKSTPDSGNPRRVNMPLAELPNKHTMVCESEQTLVKVIDPNDLRHDIERRRKERLQNEDEHIFHIDSATERNDQPFRFLTPAGRPQNPQWVKKSNSTKFTQRTYMSNFRGGRLQPHYKSGLVQKSLYIQAKYQRLRFTGSKGFITNKFRQRLLKKKEGTNMTTGV